MGPFLPDLEETIFCSFLLLILLFFSKSQETFSCSKSTIETLEKKCEICSKLTIETPERPQSRRSGVFIVNFEHISHLFLVFLLLTLNRKMFVVLLTLCYYSSCEIRKLF